MLCPRGPRLHFNKGEELFDATINADTDTMTRLLEAGISPNATDADGQTPLHRYELYGGACMMRCAMPMRHYVHTTRIHTCMSVRARRGTLRRPRC